MNSALWGSATWDFIHEIPWLLPNEVLTVKEAVNVIQLLHSLLFVLACYACSSSARIFEKQLGLVDSLLGDGNKLVTRARIARYLYRLHNLVNVKLDKPRFGMSWRDSLKKRHRWIAHFFVFAFSSMWVFDKRIKDENKNEICYHYEMLFAITLLRLFKHSEFAPIYNSFSESYPFATVLGNRDKMFDWIYRMRLLASSICGKSLKKEELEIFMEAFMARKTCGAESLGCE